MITEAVTSGEPCGYEKYVMVSKVIQNLHIGLQRAEAECLQMNVRTCGYVRATTIMSDKEGVHFSCAPLCLLCALASQAVRRALESVGDAMAHHRQHKNHD